MTAWVGPCLSMTPRPVRPGAHRDGHPDARRRRASTSTAPSASPPTWSTTATTAWSSAAPPASRRPPPTPRRTELLRAVLEAVGDRASVVAGVGTNDTAHTSSSPRQAAKAGAHGLLVVTPYYNKPTAGRACVAHFTAVADATDLPVMLYDIPGRTGIADRHRDPAAARRAPADRRGQGRQGRPVRREPGAWPAPTCSTTPATTSLNLAHLAQGAVGIVSVVAHVAGRQYAEMVAARRRAATSPAPSRCTASSSPSSTRS